MIDFQIHTARTPGRKTEFYGFPRKVNFITSFKCHSATLSLPSPFTLALSPSLVLNTKRKFTPLSLLNLYSRVQKKKCYQIRDNSNKNYRTKSSLDFFPFNLSIYRDTHPSERLSKEIPFRSKCPSLSRDKGYSIASLSERWATRYRDHLTRSLDEEEEGEDEEVERQVLCSAVLAKIRSGRREKGGPGSDSGGGEYSRTSRSN